MLIVLLIWLYTLVVAGLVGSLCCDLLCKILKCDGSRRFPFALQWLLGMALLTGLFTLASVWMPLNLAAQLVVFALALFSFWRLRLANDWLHNLLKPVQDLPRSIFFLLALAAGTILLMATLKPENFDTGLYHAQAIRWIETFPAVPGLANIHSRFGFNSSWLLTQALFSFAFLGGYSFHLNTSVLFLVAAWYFGMGVRSLLAGQRGYSQWVRTLFFPLVFYILSSEISSPGTDAPAALMSWIVLSEWLAFFEEGRPDGDLRPVLLTVISVYALTIKLTILPLVIAGLIVLAQDLLQRRWRSSLAVLALSAFVVLPWLARYVILTGYLIYPFSALDLFQVDWKLPLGKVQLESEMIRAWARLPGQGLERVQSLSFQGWAKEWLANQTANRRMILIIDLGVPFVFLALALFKKTRVYLFQKLRMSWPLWLTLYAGLAFWFINAPDFRFGAGFIIAGLVFAAGLPLSYLFDAWRSSWRVFKWALVAILIVYQAFMLVNSADFRTLPQRLVLPVDYPTSPTQPCKTGGVTWFIPGEAAYGQCWYSTFPCIPSCGQEFEWRGPDLQSGFRSK